MTSQTKQTTAGIYVHIPFCAKKCGFCDFYSVEGSHFSKEEYFQALLTELEIYQKSGILEKYTFDTLYFGGGTPSLVPEALWEMFFHHLEQNGWTEHLKEITVEMNPEDVTPSYIQTQKSFGVNRISLGIQSLDPAILSFLERRSNLSKNLEAIEQVSKTFSNYSLDFMHGIVGQDLCSELFSLGSFSPPHISTYALTLYPQTPFYRKPSSTVSEETFLSEFEEIHNFFLQMGYEHYEISNFSKPGYACLHNQHYWNGDSYLGLGAGASGLLGSVRYTNSRLENYLKSLQKEELPLETQESLEDKDRLLEMFLLQIRTPNPLLLSPLLKILENDRLRSFQTRLQKLASDQLFVYDSQTETLYPNWKSWMFSDFIAKNIYDVLYS